MLEFKVPGPESLTGLDGFPEISHQFFQFRFLLLQIAFQGLDRLAGRFRVDLVIRGQRSFSLGHQSWGSTGFEGFLGYLQSDVN
jgi:hypothetical protein